MRDTGLEHWTHFIDGPLPQAQLERPIPGASAASEEGQRVWPRGADNATILVLVSLPCAQAVNPPGRRPLPKKRLEG